MVYPYQEAQMIGDEERLTRITQVIEINRYNKKICSYQIAEQVLEVDEEYMAAESARTDGFHPEI